MKILSKLFKKNTGKTQYCKYAFDVESFFKLYYGQWSMYVGGLCYHSLLRSIGLHSQE